MLEGKTIRFMRFRNHAAIFSGLLMLACVVSLAVNGLKYGLDFTGGTQMEVNFSSPPTLELVRQNLTTAGYPNHEVLFYGTDQDVLIRIQEVSGADTGEAATGETANAVMEILRNNSSGEIELKSSSFVGSQVGDEMKEQGVLGMLVSLGMITIFIALRFQFKFSVGAVLSLAHDSIVTLGFFSITQMDFDLTVMAAVLAMIGYSLNDTIVVADRIRENFRILRGCEPEEIIDIAVTQTLGRTLITSFTTLLVLLALFFFGGQAVYGFSIALIVGVVIGTYSSIYVAATVLMFMHISKEDMMPVLKDKEALDAIP